MYNLLVTLPSFYLFVFTASSFALYLLRLVAYPFPEPETLIIFSFVLAASMMSTLYFLLIANLHKVVFQPVVKRLSRKDILFLLGLLIVSSLSFYLYFKQNISHFGLVGFGLAITSSPHLIRELNSEIGSSLSTQLSYFSWMLICYCYWLLRLRKLSMLEKFALVAIVFVFFVFNTLFIDRTRPLWIIWLILIIYFYTKRDSFSFMYVVRFFSKYIFIFLGFFVLIGFWIGKIDFEPTQNSHMPKIIESPYVYTTSGYAYINDLIVSGDYFSRQAFSSTAYPIYKILEKFNDQYAPPSQVLEFRNVGIETNVGTFLEPFLMDGGFIFVAFAIVLHTFVFDFIATRLVNRSKFIHCFFIANLCFINFIAFFVPKVSSFPMYMFFFFFILSKFVSDFFLKCPNEKFK